MGKLLSVRLLTLLMAGTLVLSGCKSSQPATSSSSSKASMSRKASKGDMKKFSDVITKDAVTDDGVFNVHKVDEDYFFEIPDEMLDREFLLVSRVAGSTQNLSFGGAGQKARQQQVVRWQRKDDMILLRHVSYESVADEDDPVYKSVKNNNFEPVIATFDIDVNVGERF